MSDFRPGVRLAFDWGRARIGVAACDRDGILAFPVETISVSGGEFARVAALVAEYHPLECVLGLPTTLAGGSGLAAEYIEGIAAELAGQLPVPVRLVDERLTTAQAAKQLSAAGKSAKRQRKLIDQAAAVGILEQALAAERAGQLPGRLVTKESHV